LKAKLDSFKNMDPNYAYIVIYHPDFLLDVKCRGKMELEINDSSELTVPNNSVYVLRTKDGRKIKIASKHNKLEINPEIGKHIYLRVFIVRHRQVFEQVNSVLGELESAAIKNRQELVLDK